jgi:alcohol dehydrogenase
VGVDTLVHAIEAELSVYGHNLFVKSYARQAMRLVYRFLPAVYENSQDKQAREKMAYAEFMAGVAFNSASLGFIHSLSHAMSGVFNTPHGLANAVLMPYVLDYELNFKKVVSKLSKIGDYMDIDLISSDEFGKAKEVVREIVAFLKKLGIPSALKDVQPNISKNQIREMASKAMKDFCGISNPVQFSKKEVIHIYKNAIAGKFENI